MVVKFFKMRDFSEVFQNRAFKLETFSVLFSNDNHHEWMNSKKLEYSGGRKGLHFLLHHLLVWPFWSLFSLFTGKLGNWQKRKKRQSTCCSTAIMMSGKLWLILGCCSPEIGVKVYYIGSAGVWAANRRSFAPSTQVANGERLELGRPYKSVLPPSSSFPNGHRQQHNIFV